MDVYKYFHIPRIKGFLKDFWSPVVHVELIQLSSVQSHSHVRLFATHELQHARLSCPQQLPESMQTHVHWLGDTIQPSHPQLSASLPTFKLSQHQVFSNESVLRIRWPKYWSFSISPSNDIQDWISFRIDWLDLIAVQGTLKSLLQHHSSKASILQHSAFFIVQLSHQVAKILKLQHQSFQWIVKVDFL